MERGVGKGKEAMIKGGCNFFESGVRVLLWNTENGRVGSPLV